PGGPGGASAAILAVREGVLLFLPRTGHPAVKPELICKMEREELPCMPDPPGVSVLGSDPRLSFPGAGDIPVQRVAGGVPEGLSAPSALLQGMPERGRRRRRGLARSQPGRSRGGPSGLHQLPAPRPLEKTPPTCPECDKRFKSQTALAIHERSHTGERPFACARCGKAFPSKGDLKRHQKTHAGKPDPPRPGTGLPAKLQPTRSPRVPPAPRRPHACTECGKSFGKSRDLRKHQQTHTPARPFSCPQCGRRFRLKQILASHQKVHGGEKPFGCG
uniref:C2H2-type domain-containing protein n=1 Tax=Athene cunicularia TaxID=194338 RepID=A0A663M484_ATHCN